MKRLILAAVVLVARQLNAHDFWIEPSAYQARVGQRVTLDLRVGEHFAGDSIPRNPPRIVRFERIAGDTVSAVDGTANAAPAGGFVPMREGIHVIAYESRGSVSEMTPPAFERYLREEGLANRVGRARANRVVRDRFIRCAKSFITVGNVDHGWERRAGLTLELSPRINPLGLRPGDTLPVNLSFRGKPLPGALVVAIDKTSRRSISARTSAAGDVSLELDAPGEWLIKAVHLVVSEAPGVDYDSYWASLTFTID